MARRRVPDLPVESIIDHPGFIAMPAAGRGMLFTIILFHWQTGFRSIEIKGHLLFATARAHPTTWFHHKDEIMNILNDVKDELMASWTHQTELYNSRVAHMISIRSLSRMSRMKKKRPDHGSRDEARVVRSTEVREGSAPRPEGGGERQKFRSKLRG